MPDTRDAKKKKDEGILILTRKDLVSLVSKKEISRPKDPIEVNEVGVSIK